MGTTRHPGSKNAIVTCVAVFVLSVGCDKKPSEAKANPAPQEPPAVVETATPSSAAPPPAEPPPPAATGTLTIEPNPVVVCEKTGLGSATVSWAAQGTKVVEIRIGAPDGKLFTNAPPTGSAKTENWVKKGTAFFLQNVDKGAPLTAANTIARLDVDVVNGPCR